MKFIKQSSIDNLIDETLTLLLEPLTKKKGVHYFCFSPLRAKRNSFFMCACCKNFFMTTQRVSVETPCSSSWKNTQRWTSLKLSSSWDHRNSTRVRRAKRRCKENSWRNIVHEKIVQFCSDQYQKFNSLQADDWAKQMMLTDRGFSQRYCKNLWLALLLMKEALFLLH
jgi:hypothetical protein